MATANSIGLRCLYGAHGHMDRRRKCKLEDVPTYQSEATYERKKKKRKKYAVHESRPVRNGEMAEMAGRKSKSTIYINT